MKNKEFFIISLTIFLTVVIWIIADIYHIQKTEKIKSLNPKFLKPMSIDINQETFKILQILEKKR